MNIHNDDSNEMYHLGEELYNSECPWDVADGSKNVRVANDIDQYFRTQPGVEIQVASVEMYDSCTEMYGRKGGHRDR